MCKEGYVYYVLILCSEQRPHKEAKTVQFPLDLLADVRAALMQQGYRHLYSHQV